MSRQSSTRLQQLLLLRYRVLYDVASGDCDTSFAIQIYNLWEAQLKDMSETSRAQVREAWRKFHNEHST